MSKLYKLSECQELEYYGDSDLLAQIASELQCNPNSCFAKNVVAWYNALYSAPESFDDCRYQIETQKPSNLEDAIDLLQALVAGQNKRVAVVSIRVICREVQRRLSTDLSPSL